MEPILAGARLRVVFATSRRPAFWANFPLAAGGILRNLLVAQLVSCFEIGFNSFDQHEIST
jgi:hypothetical protein